MTKPTEKGDFAMKCNQKTASEFDLPALMLTPSEQESLRQDLKESNIYFEKLYAKAV